MRYTCLLSKLRPTDKVQVFYDLTNGIASKIGILRFVTNMKCHQFDERLAAS